MVHIQRNKMAHDDDKGKKVEPDVKELPESAQCMYA